ncbi:dipeptidase [Leptolyngbya sp. 15MV]|nr:dipeptidase [Leptolyngbya sp. 15MV]
MLPFFDAHLDLACLAELGRDMSRDPSTCGGPWQPAALTFPSLAEGRVRFMLGTIFTEAGGTDAVGYPPGDAQAAHLRGLAQLSRYHAWDEQRVLKIVPSPLLNRAVAPALGLPFTLACLDATAPRCLLLMECADPIRSPDELPFWVERGLAAVGLAWARGSRYAAGNAEPSCLAPYGLTSEGRELVRAMDMLGLVHDVSHLSDRAFDEVLELASGPVMASHSNSRAIVSRGQSSREPPPFGHRHLTDDQIRRLVARDGVIGLNLFSKFIRADLSGGRRPSVAEAIDHVEHICAIAGHRRAVGLGSDLDGGLTAEQLPEGISRPADFVKLIEELSRRGWTQEDIEGFAWRNWARFWRIDQRGQAER